MRVINRTNPLPVTDKLNWNATRVGLALELCENNNNSHAEQMPRQRWDSEVLIIICQANSTTERPHPLAEGRSGKRAFVSDNVYQWWEEGRTCNKHYTDDLEITPR